MIFNQSPLSRALPVKFVYMSAIRVKKSRVSTEFPIPTLNNGLSSFLRYTCWNRFHLV